MTFILVFFKFHCKSQHKQENWNGTKKDKSRSDSICPELQRGTLFEWLLKYIPWSVYLKNGQ